MFDLSDLISDIIEDYKEQLDNENVKLTSKFIYYNKSSETVNKRNTEEGKINNISILADRTRINQVISNLLSNAIKFTDEGTIDLAIEKQDSKNNIYL